MREDNSMTGYPLQKDVDIANDQELAFWISGYWLLVMMEQSKCWMFGW
jgi:hypothetical protein